MPEKDSDWPCTSSALWSYPSIFSWQAQFVPNSTQILAYPNSIASQYTPFNNLL